MNFWPSSAAEMNLNLSYVHSHGYETLFLHFLSAFSLFYEPLKNSMFIHVRTFF